MEMWKSASIATVSFAFQQWADERMLARREKLRDRRRQMSCLIKMREHAKQSKGRAKREQKVLETGKEKGVSVCCHEGQAGGTESPEKVGGYLSVKEDFQSSSERSQVEIESPFIRRHKLLPSMARCSQDEEGFAESERDGIYRLLQDEHQLLLFHMVEVSPDARNNSESEANRSQVGERKHRKHL
eukprot:760348-Hanusia_phi.AAC.6